MTTEWMGTGVQTGFRTQLFFFLGGGALSCLRCVLSFCFVFLFVFVLSISAQTRQDP